MDVEGSKYKIGFELETSIRERYLEGIRRIRESDDPQKYFYELDLIFKALGESRPSKNDKITWAEDMIRAYRNMGRIFTTLSSKQDFISLPQSNEIFSDHEELLAEFGEGKTLDTMNEALKYLTEVRAVLVEYDFEYDNISELKKELKYAREISDVLKDWGLENNPSKLEKKLEKVEDLKTKVGDLNRKLEEGFSEF